MSETATLDEATVPHPDDADEPRSLTEYLDLHHLSERRLAKMLDISQSHLSLIRRGLRTPSVKVAKAISHHTHIPLDDLLRSFTPAVIAKRKRKQQRKHRR